MFYQLTLPIYATGVELKTIINACLFNTKSGFSGGKSA